MTVQPSPPADYLPLVNIRLIASDMDGTLIGDDGKVPEPMWALLERLKKADILFTPASGRQVAALEHTFEGATERMPFIGENGALVVRDGEVLYSLTVAPEIVTRLVGIVRGLASDGMDIGVILAGKRGAYTDRRDEAFLEQAARYYRKMDIVEDVLNVKDDIVKVAICSFDDIDDTLVPLVEPFEATHSVVSSVKNWLDVTEKGADKGNALKRLQEYLGISDAETIVFGDYLNDMQMIEAAQTSFAVANAHAEIIAAATHIAPSCEEQGVIQVIERILDENPSE
ncbi:HAD family hydrolase [Actinomycetaceae bacterium L2_0104]